MDKIIQKKQVIETLSSKDTRQQSITERTYRQQIQATEPLPSQSPPDAASGRTLGKKHETGEKFKRSSNDYSSSQPHRRSSQHVSSSRPRSLSTSQMRQPKKEISATPKSAEGSSKLGTNKRTSLTPLKGGFIGSHVNIDNKGGTVIYKSDGVRISGHNKNDDSDSHPQE
jgi:hypothetical protein